MCRCCDGWGVQSLPAWILSDWGRSVIVGCTLGIPYSVRAAIVCAVTCDGLVARIALWGSSRQDRGLPHTCWPRVQGLQRLANASRAWLGHTRPDQVVRFSNCSGRATAYVWCFLCVGVHPLLHSRAAHCLLISFAALLPTLARARHGPGSSSWALVYTAVCFTRPFSCSPQLYVCNIPCRVSA